MRDGSGASARGAGLDALIDRELGRTSAGLARIRAAAAVVLCVFGAAFVAAEPTVWQAWVLFPAAVALFALSVYDARVLSGRSFSVALYAYVVGTVLAFQTVIVVVTGGADSPFLIVYVPIAVVSGFTLARPRPFLLAVLVPATLVWVFVVGHVAGWLPPLTPELLGGPVPGGRTTAYVVTDGAVLTFVMLLGGSVGLSFRQAVERAARTAALARQEAVQGMRERNRELIALSGAIAHELKNPLASIQGLAGLLTRRLPAESREAEQVGVLLGEARRMGAILEEFLNFSRPIHGLAVRPVDPAAAVEDVATLHEGVAAERGVRLEVERGPVAAVAADPRKVRQVLVNLLQNALDASPRGGTVVLRVAAAPGGGARFTVEDEGEGLGADVRGRLFTPGATTKVAGSGLGLVVARSIVEQHGGTLALDERPEGGVRATFRLPARPPETDPGDAAVAENEEDLP